MCCFSEVHGSRPSIAVVAESIPTWFAPVASVDSSTEVSSFSPIREPCRWTILAIRLAKRQPAPPPLLSIYVSPSKKPPPPYPPEEISNVSRYIGLKNTDPPTGRSIMDNRTPFVWTNAIFVPLSATATPVEWVVYPLVAEDDNVDPRFSLPLDFCSSELPRATFSRKFGPPPLLWTPRPLKRVIAIDFGQPPRNESCLSTKNRNFSRHPACPSCWALSCLQYLVTRFLGHERVSSLSDIDQFPFLPRASS